MLFHSYKYVENPSKICHTETLKKIYTITSLRLTLGRLTKYFQFDLFQKTSSIEFWNDVGLVNLSNPV